MSKKEKEKTKPTQEEYIAELIEARKQEALNRSRTRTYPRVPMSGTRMSKKEWEQDLNDREDLIREKLQKGFITPFIRNLLNSELRTIAVERSMGYDAYRGTGEPLGSSCTATAFDNYGMDIVSSELFRQNHKKHGFKQVDNSNVLPSDIVIDVENGKGSHTLMLDSGTVKENNLRFNASNGGFEPLNLRKNARYPFKGSMESYTYTGTPADSVLWINLYKQIYGMAKGGIIGIPRYLGGTPEGGIKRSYIGGTKSETRKKYFNLDKELTLVVTNLATSYGISPALAIDRLAHEGVIDWAIGQNNWISKGNDPKNSYFVNGSSIVNNEDFNMPYNAFGLDYIFDTYTKGVTKTKRPINFQRDPGINESNERVNSGWTNNIYDTLELFVAELASRRNQVKKQYPNLTDAELDSATAARYNATNKYFKYLMDSGEYKTEYPIDVEGVNIPAPTKIDSKYIKDQTINLDLDETFMEMPYEEYVYDNKSWNPDLFLEDGKVVYPDNEIVRGILKGYTKRNFSEPEQVSFVYKEGAKIHKPNGHRAITDNGWIPTKRLKKGTYGLIKKK